MTTAVPKRIVSEAACETGVPVLPTNPESSSTVMVSAFDAFLSYKYEN
jgi:hypothetical protein